MIENLKCEPRSSQYGYGIYEVGTEGLRMFITDGGRVIPVQGRGITPEDLMQAFVWGRIEERSADPCPCEGHPHGEAVGEQCPVLRHELRQGSRGYRRMRACPICGAPSMEVIYFGFPLLLCRDESCSCAFGFWSWIFAVVPFNGAYMTYDKGRLAALWCWLRGK